MEKTIRLLSILLAAQLLLAVGMSFTGPNLAAVNPDTPLFTLGDQPVDHLTLEGPDGARVALERKARGWVLPEMAGFPADRTQVETLLTRLKDLKHGLPVATTSGAPARFKVSDESFERRLRLSHGGDTLVTLYLGTSPDMRHVHARTGKDEAVYAVDFPVYEAPVKAEDWEDKGILQFPKDSIEAIEVAGLAMHRTPAATTDNATAGGEGKRSAQATWEGEGLGQGEVVNPAGAEDLARRLAELRIGAVLGTEAKPEYGLDKPALTLSLTRQGGEKLEYRLGVVINNSYAVLKSSNRPEYFRLPSYTAESLTKAAARAQLVQAAPTPAANSPAGQPEGGNRDDTKPGVTDQQGGAGRPDAGTSTERENPPD